MSDTLTSRIVRLRALTPQLNQVTDDAARLVARVEKFLNEDVRISIPASVIVGALAENEHEEDELFNCEPEWVALRYDRHGSKYRILVSVFEYKCDKNGCALDYDEIERSSDVPWAEASRFLKLSTIHHLPSLLDKLIRQAEEEIEEVPNVASTIEEMMAALEAPGSQSEASPAEAVEAVQKPEKPNCLVFKQVGRWKVATLNRRRGSKAK
jgi:hypothetical protein